MAMVCLKDSLGRWVSIVFSESLPALQRARLESRELVAGIVVGDGAHVFGLL